MKTREESYLSYCFLGLCHLILYRTTGDSEAENLNWYDSLSDEEDARKRAVSEDGGGQGGAEQGRCAESRPGAGPRVRTDPEWVEVVLIMLSQLPTRVTGSEPGPAGHSSLSGIARSKVQGR